MTEYEYRAMVALVGLGANPVDVAIYPKTATDSSGAQLSGSKTYTRHFDSLPPMQKGGFWSVTAYGSDDFLIANEINRYCVNDRSGFKTNTDNSLDVILSKTQPKSGGWLPVDGDFHLVMRIYQPDTEALEDWTPPVIYEGEPSSTPQDEPDKSGLGLNANAKPATKFTADINAAVYKERDFSDTQEYEFATRGLINAPEKLELRDKSGKVIWSQAAYNFIDEYDKAPDSVNPSLWENTRNNHAYGLFEVIKYKIYQVRGYDMANLTVVKGDTGWIVFDTLMSVECSQAAMQLIAKNLGDYPVKAVIISHSHADHFGGILGIMAADEKADENLSFAQQAASGKIPVIAPAGFTEAAIKENIYVGKGMGRRTNYQYGILLTPGPTGKLAQGIGMAQSSGAVSFLTPSYEIKTDETLIIDGVTLQFQLTPDSETPAEMNTWLPDLKALWVAENCTATLHNLYTLRGAQVRDGLAWANYIIEAVQLFGSEAQVTFQSHNWPHWGNEVVNNYLINTAAVYKSIHDQTLTYINQGYTSDEISNKIKLPPYLNKLWYTRQYYGTVAHDSKAVYQKYMGWYDSNPVNLNPLDPTESAKKWLEYLGDADAVLRKAKADYDKGEYRWVAKVTNTLVFADPKNRDARLLCADALEQLGYQSESGPWRNEYLTAAKELREGNSDFTSGATGANTMISEADASMIVDYIAVAMDKNALADKDFCMNLNLTDVNQRHGVRFRHGVVLFYENAPFANAELTLTCPKTALFAIVSRNEEQIAKAIKVDGDESLFKLITGNMDEFPTGPNPFNIIEP